MSTRFDFGFACDLKPDTPERVLRTLTYMVGEDESGFDNPPEDEVFEGDWWRTALREPYLTYPYPGEAGSALKYVYRYEVGERKVYRHTLSFRGEVSLDVLAEYLMWLCWLARYSESEGCVGYYRATTADELAPPELLYFRDGKLGLLTVEGEPMWVED